MKKLISFVIPAHNAESTIENCISSIAICIDERIEIIVVENFSSDKTYEIVNKLSQKDKRIKLVSSDKGVSNARNKGIELSEGEKIVFVDADDAITIGGIDLLITEACCEEADLVVFGHISGEEKREVSNKDKTFSDENIINIKVLMIEDPTKYMQAWAKLYSKEIIDRYNIRFNPKLKLAEDSDFTLHYLMHCERIKFSSKIIYRYFLNPSSAMRTFDNNKVMEYVSAMETSAETIKKEPTEIISAFNKYILMHTNIIMVREIFNNKGYENYSKRIVEMKKVIREPIIQNAFASTKISDCCSLRMFPILLCKIGFIHIASVIYMIRVMQNHMRESR